MTTRQSAILLSEALVSEEAFTSDSPWKLVESVAIFFSKAIQEAQFIEDEIDPKIVATAYVNSFVMRNYVNCFSGWMDGVRADAEVDNYDEIATQIAYIRFGLEEIGYEPYKICFEQMCDFIGRNLNTIFDVYEWSTDFSDLMEKQENQFYDYFSDKHFYEFEAKFRDYVRRNITMVTVPDDALDAEILKIRRRDPVANQRENSKKFKFWRLFGSREPSGEQMSKVIYDHFTRPKKSVDRPALATIFINK